MWLGAKSTPTVSKAGRNFVFSATKQLLTFTNWARNQPDNSANGEGCVQMTVEGLWNDINCYFKGYQHATMCEIDVKHGIPVHGKGKCITQKFIKSDGQVFCGFFLEMGLSWHDADQRCKAQGARLPEIKSEIEQKQIMQLKVGKVLYYLQNHNKMFTVFIELLM